MYEERGKHFKAGIGKEENLNVLRDHSEETKWTPHPESEYKPLF